MNSFALGLYVHIPFCSVRCAYCDFATDLEEVGEREKYLRTLQTELSQKINFVPSSLSDRVVDSIYFGGGTPSLLHVTEIEQIFSMIQESFALDSNLEWTIEVNPEGVNSDKVEQWKGLGVNRVSIGIQSLHDQELKYLGRRHLRDQNLESLKILSQSELRWNADLMIGLPGQSAQSLKESIRILIESGCEHISVYMLSIEEGAPWYQKVSEGKIKVLSDDLTANLYEELIDSLSEAGLNQYEISAFCTTNQECKHNLKYWRNLPYLGIGPSAGSWINPYRFQNSRGLHSWIDQIQKQGFSEDFEELSAKSAFLDSVMLQFRLVQGVPHRVIDSGIEKFPELELKSRLERVMKRGLVERFQEGYKLTRPGLLFANEVFLEFFD